MTRVRALAHTMDDRHAQFLIVVADACLGAELGELIVEILTFEGVRHCGVPTMIEGEQPDGPQGGALRVDGSVVALADVVEFLVWPPGESTGSSPMLNDP
jgi:hypothetical protein